MAVIALIIAVVAVSAGVFGWMFAKKSKVAVETKQDVPVQEDKQEVVSENVAADEFKEWKTFKNEKYGFEFKYPSEWILEGEKSVFDEVNKLPVIVDVKDGKGHIFSVTVNLKGTLGPSSMSENTEKLEVSGFKATAYILPGGPGGPIEADGDFSTFSIPIIRNGILYELGASGEAENTIFYKDIISTFKFTK